MRKDHQPLVIRHPYFSITNNKGVALLIVLLIITLMGVIIFEFHYRSRVDLVQARNRADWIKAFYIAKSGINGMKEVLLDDAKESSYDGPDEKWAQEIPGLPVGAGLLFIKVVDEGGKFNINTLVPNSGVVDEEAVKRFDRLLEEIGLEPGLKGDIVEFLKERKDTKYKIDDLSELLDLNSLDPEDLDMLERVVTTDSGGKININTAPREVVFSLSDSLTQDMIDDIISHRGEEPFKSITVTEFQKASAGIDDKMLITFSGTINTTSAYFTIHSQAEVNGMIKGISATVSREGGKIKVLKWKER
ncbi:MAG: type II secretion system minor pseudopilin GspK [Thermodesulfobacteriota bacterium]